jgi:hypothetical protein
MSKYVAALHVYEDVGGKLHTSYASTLANLGVLYKDLARDASGLERQQLLERSSEALGDALSIRTSLLGEPICSMRNSVGYSLLQYVPSCSIVCISQIYMLYACPSFRTSSQRHPVLHAALC